MTVTDASPRPRGVSMALLLLIAWWAISMGRYAWRMLISPEFVDFVGSLMIVAFVVAVSGGLIAEVAYRRRWAYLVLLCLFALGLARMLSGLSAARAVWAGGPLSVLWYVVDLAVLVAVVVLLLRRPSREWYGISRPPAPPGEWRPDPGGRHQLRYWDGRVWTEHVADDGVVGVDPLAKAQASVPLTSASS